MHSLCEYGEGEGAAGGGVECGEAGARHLASYCSFGRQLRCRLLQEALNDFPSPPLSGHLHAEWCLVVQLSIFFSKL